MSTHELEYCKENCHKLEFKLSPKIDLQGENYFSKFDGVGYELLTASELYEELTDINNETDCDDLPF